MAYRWCGKTLKADHDSLPWYLYGRSHFLRFREIAAERPFAIYMLARIEGRQDYCPMLGHPDRDYNHVDVFGPHQLKAVGIGTMCPERGLRLLGEGVRSSRHRDQNELR